MEARLAVISSYFSPAFLGAFEARVIETPWGTAAVEMADVDGETVACLWRYGRALALASHRINFRANLWALRALGVERCVSQNAIGSVNPDIPPGAVVVSDDFIDFTKDRPRSFFDDADAWVRVDLTVPFCPELRGALVEAGRPVFDDLRDRGTFICVEGPRFESPAEIRMFRMWGADVIGTPLVPEVVLAREAEICFASIAPVINFATGLASEVRHVGEGSMVDFYYGPARTRPGAELTGEDERRPEERSDYRSGFHDRVEEAIRAALRALPRERACACGRALEHAFHGTPPAWFTPRR